MSAPPKQKRDVPFIAHSIQRPPAKTSATAEAWGKERHSYKPLPTRFRHGGFDYRQIAHEGGVAVYEQTWNSNEGSAAFEVIRIRRREGFEIGERLVEPAETYPKAEAWGVDGWTMQDKEAAFRKLQEVAFPKLER